jgi:hypothetical protein
MNIRGKLIFLILFPAILAFPSFGQTVKPIEKPAAPADGPRRNLDESFELNIVQRRITEENFSASTSISTNADSNVNLQVGVGVAAGRIDVQLRNVHGQVRFRGSLDRIFEILDGKRPATAIPQ